MQCISPTHLSNNFNKHFFDTTSFSYSPHVLIHAHSVKNKIKIKKYHLNWIGNSVRTCSCSCSSYTLLHSLLVTFFLHPTLVTIYTTANSSHNSVFFFIVQTSHRLPYISALTIFNTILLYSSLMLQEFSFYLFSPFDTFKICKISSFFDIFCSAVLLN